MTNKTLMKIMGFCAAVAGVLVFIMMFLTAVTTGGDNPSTLTGAQLAFGAQTFDFGVLKERFYSHLVLPLLIYYQLHQ